MNVPLLYFLFRTETRPWLRWLIAAMLLFSYPAVVFTYSRGAWIGLAMATALLFLRMRNKVLIIGAAGTIALIVAIFLPHVMPQRLLNRYDQLVNYEQDDSAESRFWNWEFCKRVGMAGRSLEVDSNFLLSRIMQSTIPSSCNAGPANNGPVIVFGSRSLVNMGFQVFCFG